MAIVALVAVDCLAIRVGRSFRTFNCLIDGALPMQFALAIGLLLMYRLRLRMEKVVPFLIGFEVIGWISLLIYVAVCVLALQTLENHVNYTLGPVVSAIGFQPLSTPDLICRYSITMTYLTAPQLAAALVAGWISQRWWKRTHPGSVPTHN